MNIGLAPLAGVDGEGVTARLLCAVRDHAGSFNFDGLRSFKAKWRPRWESRYIAYEYEIDLPRIAVAIARAGELEPPRPERRSVVVARQYPFSLAMIGLTLWFSIATNLDPRFERVLHGRFGFSYQGLVHLELWRLVTAPAVESRAGFVWLTFALVMIVLPTAENRLGTRRTIIAFFVGAFAATVPALLVLAVTGTGNEMGIARDFLRVASPSAGCWALAMVLVFTIVTPSRRRIAAVVAVGGLIVVLLAVPEVSGAECVLAASAGALLGGWWSRGTPARRTGRSFVPQEATASTGRMEEPSVVIEGRAPVRA
jgi:lysylphosphatidylglycerol synthetase-like protein (DUF2156 family)